MRRLTGLVLPIIALLIVTSNCKFDEQTAPIPVADTSVPSLILPLNNSSDQSVNQIFQWDSENAVSYDLLLDKFNPPANVAAAGIKTKTYTNPLPLDYGFTYFWRVRANLPDGSQKISAVQSFKTTLNLNPAANGYALYFKDLSTELPNLVHLIFQVVDLNGKTVPVLQRSDFDFYEDGLPIQSESLVEIKKRDELAFKLRTVLMLDNSTSLTATELNNIRTAVKSFIANMKPYQETAIYQFSENVEKLSGFTSDKDSLNRSADRYSGGKSTTALYKAVVTGASLWKDNLTFNNAVQGTMIIFTDGNETSTPTSAALADALSAVYNKIVFSIGLSGKDPLDVETLKKIGTAGYFGITSTTQLDAQFSLVQKSISDYANSFYQLNYKSPRRGGGDYSVILKLKNNPYNGDLSYIISKYSSAGFVSKRGNQ